MEESQAHKIAGSQAVTAGHTLSTATYRKDVPGYGIGPTFGALQQQHGRQWHNVHALQNVASKPVDQNHFVTTPNV